MCVCVCVCEGGEGVRVCINNTKCSNIYSSGQLKVYVAVSFNDRSTVKRFRVKRKRNVTKTLTPKQNGVETVKKRRVTERETAATMVLRRATNALQAAVSYNSLDTHEKPLLHEGIESSVRFPVLSLR